MPDQTTTQTQGIFEKQTEGNIKNTVGSRRKRRKYAKGWSPERSKRQAAIIRLIRPWCKSTGPRSIEDKRRISRNALRHGHYAAHWKVLRTVLHAHLEFCRKIRLQLIKETTIGTRRNNSLLPHDIMRQGMHVLHDLKQLVDYFRKIGAEN